MDHQLPLGLDLPVSPQPGEQTPQVSELEIGPRRRAGFASGVGWRWRTTAHF